MDTFTLEHILFSITVLGAFGSLIAIVIKIGELKATTNDNITQLKKDVADIKEHDKTQDKEICDIKQTNLQAIHRVESLLVEVSTKINMLMQLTGFFDKDGCKRD